MASSHTTADPDRITQLEERIEELERRLETFERLFSSDIIEKSKAHSTASRNNDAREQFAPGEIHEVVVQEIEQDHNGPTGVGKLDGVVTFIQPGDVDLRSGDLATVRISDTQKNNLHAIALNKP